MGRKRVAKEEPQLPVPAEALSRRRQGVWSCAGAPHLSLVKPCRRAGMEFREGCGSREIDSGVSVSLCLEAGAKAEVQSQSEDSERTPACCL